MNDYQLYKYESAERLEKANRQRLAQDANRPEQAQRRRIRPR